MKIKELTHKITSIILEGIDFDKETMSVWFTPSDEEYVDTSLINNPTVDKEIVPHIEVWSIFKRKKGKQRDDGNPLIYALKDEKGWKFKNESDRKEIEKQFNLIAEKFAEIHPIDVTILLPSSNSLNKHIADVVMSKSQNSQLIEGAISKLTVDEVDDIVLKPNSKFREYYKDEFKAAYAQLETYFDAMDTEKGGIFTRHYIKDSKMRDVLSDTLKVTNSRYARKSKYINGKDILIIDDTISRGQSIKEACRIMSDSYSPKSITVLTLMSRLP